MTMQVTLLSLLIVGLIVGGQANCLRKDIRDCSNWLSMKLCGREPYNSKCLHACGGCKFLKTII